MQISRRTWLGSLAAAIWVRSTRAQDKATGPIPIVAIHQMRMLVSDLNRSVTWYQQLLGMTVIARQAKRAVLAVGDGPQHIVLSESRDQEPRIAHMGFSVEQFDANETLSQLASLGVVSGDKLGPGRAIIRQTDRGSGSDVWRGPRLLLQDHDGITVQLQDRSDRGAKFTQTDEAHLAKTAEGVLKVRDFNHFTSFVSDSVRTVAFYRQLFRLPIDTYQGSMPLLRVGEGNQFLAFAGAGGQRGFQPRIHHACFTVEKFDPDKVLGQLAEFGISHRQRGRGPVAPLTSYVTMRMPDRGGAPGGTPELYFTDPDGILLQIQDVRYSGGSGFLGDRRGGGETKSK